MKNEFQEIVQKAIDQGLTDALCVEFELGPSQDGGFGNSTVLKWASGIATPLPRFKNIIIQFIKERLNEV